MSAPVAIPKPNARPRDALIERLTTILPALLAGGPITLAYLYGSAASGAATPLSDVDIAFVVSDESALARRFELEADLAARLAAQGISNIDVRLVNDAPLMLRGAIVTQGVLVYAADDRRRIEFESFTRRLYFDYLPVARRMQEDYIQAVLNRPDRIAQAAP